jgi:hypothetical protein
MTVRFLDRLPITTVADECYNYLLQLKLWLMSPKMEAICGDLLAYNQERLNPI